MIESALLEPEAKELKREDTLCNNVVLNSEEQSLWSANNFVGRSSATLNDPNRFVPPSGLPWLRLFSSIPLFSY